MMHCPARCSENLPDWLRSSLQPRVCSFFSRASTNRVSLTHQCQWVRETLFLALRSRTSDLVKRSVSPTLENSIACSVTRATNYCTSSASARHAFQVRPSTEPVKCDANCFEIFTLSAWGWIWASRIRMHRRQSSPIIASDRQDIEHPSGVDILL